MGVRAGVGNYGKVGGLSPGAATPSTTPNPSDSLADWLTGEDGLDDDALEPGDEATTTKKADAVEPVPAKDAFKEVETDKEGQPQVAVEVVAAEEATKEAEVVATEEATDVRAAETTADGTPKEAEKEAAATDTPKEAEKEAVATEEVAEAEAAEPAEAAETAAKDAPQDADTEASAASEAAAGARAAEETPNVAPKEAETEAAATEQGAVAKAAAEKKKDVVVKKEIDDNDQATRKPCRTLRQMLLLRQRQPNAGLPDPPALVGPQRRAQR